jgi:hypothetical protein
MRIGVGLFNLIKQFAAGVKYDIGVIEYENIKEILDSTNPRVEVAFISHTSMPVVDKMFVGRSTVLPNMLTTWDLFRLYYKGRMVFADSIPLLEVARFIRYHEVAWEVWTSIKIKQMIDLPNHEIRGMHVLRQLRRIRDGQIRESARTAGRVGPALGAPAMGDYQARETHSAAMPEQHRA